MTKLKTVLFAAIAALFAASAAVLAGNTIFPTSIGDLTFPFTAPLRDGTAGTIDNMTVGATTPRAGTFTVVNGAVGSTTKAVAYAGFSYTFGNHQTKMLLNPTGTVAHGYVTLAPAPADGAEACVFSTEEVTLFYLSANAGQSINDAVTALTALTRYCYVYSASDTSWDRSQ